MDHTITALERAFQLARSGNYGSVADTCRNVYAALVLGMDHERASCRI